MSGLESEVKSLNGAANESRPIIEINTSNIGSINGTIGGINNSIIGLYYRVIVLEDRHDYTTEINRINDSKMSSRTDRCENNILLFL
jgi:hypothetical protein